MLSRFKSAVFVSFSQIAILAIMLDNEYKLKCVANLVSFCFELVTWASSRRLVENGIQQKIPVVHLLMQV